MDKQTQKQRVLEYMQKNGSITPMDALKHIGSFRLGDRIYELKEELKSEGKDIVNLNKTGSERYAKYIIRQKLPISEKPQEDTEIIQVQVPCQKCRSYYRRGKRCNICGAIVKP